MSLAALVEGEINRTISTTEVLRRYNRLMRMATGKQHRHRAGSAEAKRYAYTSIRLYIRCARELARIMSKE